MTKTLLPALVCLALSLRVTAQTTPFVTPDSITFAVHRENIGRIAFMGAVIPIERFGSGDFLREFEIKPKTDLNIRVFMGNSLTNYLHQLAPEASIEELTLSGNFQFTFLIDGVRIYTENLHYGAFGAENKNKKTVFRVPLISSTNEDSWGRFLWNRFMAGGGQEALSSGTHLLTIEIRPYLKRAEIIAGNLIAEGNIRIVVPDKPVSEQQLQVQIVKPLKDWEISAAGIDTQRIRELNRRIATESYKDIRSIIVIKNGQLLLEEYFNGARRNTLHDTRSVGKSFAGAILGMAIQDGYIKGEHQGLGEFYNLQQYSHYSPAKERIELKDLLTMSSVFDGSDMLPESPGNEENMYPTSNWVEFALNLPLDSHKISQKRWDYFTAGVVLLGDVIHRSTPGGLERYAGKQLFQPLGIQRYKWQYTPQKVANTAGSLQLRALDLAKFGQLYQNRGAWNGQQILPAAWVSKSLSYQAEIAAGEHYGYLFWNKTYEVEGKRYEVWYAGGNGGNRIIIFKDQPLVMVITATAYNKPYGHTQADNIVQKYLIPAVMR